LTCDPLLIGLACSLEPIALTGFILTLSAEHGVRKGLFFPAGRVLSLAVIGVTLTSTAGQPSAPNTAPSVGVLAAKILVGAAQVVFAWHHLRSR